MYHVIRDSKEKLGWMFQQNEECSGMSVKGLKTGDYTIKGLEDRFVIERKGSVTEWSGNCTQKRFVRELERLEEFDFPFLILEFTPQDILQFPFSSSIPRRKWRYLRVTGKFLWKQTGVFIEKYKTKLIFAGPDGFNVAQRLMREFAQKCLN